MLDNHDISTNDNNTFESTPNFISIPLASTTRAGGNGKMTLGLTFTKDCGKNLVISDMLYKAIGSPEKIQVAILNGKLAIGAFINDIDMFYSMCNQKKHKVVYNTMLINGIVDYFNLDYSKCSHKTFYDIDFINITVNNAINKVALISMDDNR